MHVQLALYENWPAKRYRGRRHRHNDQLWCTEIHEAVHAVFAYWLRVPFTSVTIRPALGRLGLVTIDPEYWVTHDTTDYSSHVGATAAVLVAGTIAVETPALKPNRRARAPGTDYYLLDKLVEHCAGREALIEGVEQGVRDALTSDHIRLMVYSLAITLERRISLTHDEAVRAMTGGALDIMTTAANDATNTAIQDCNSNSTASKQPRPAAVLNRTRVFVANSRKVPTGVAHVRRAWEDQSHPG